MARLQDCKIALKFEPTRQGTTPQSSGCGEPRDYSCSLVPLCNQTSQPLPKKAKLLESVRLNFRSIALIDYSQEVSSSR